MSFGVVGAHGEDGPDLRPLVADVRSTAESLKRSHSEAGWLEWNTWSLLWVTPDGQQHSQTFRDGIVDESVWEDAVSGVPEEYDLVELSSGLWGRVALSSPDHRYHGRKVRSLSACVRVPAKGEDAAAGAFSAALARAARIPGVLTGFVHVDSIEDPYTTVITKESRIGEERFDHQLSGYYWTVLLTRGHIARLGGVDAVRREAPASRVDEVESNRLLCQLTSAPSGAGVSHYQAWREYLRPLLRSGYPIGWEDVGRRGTPLARPLWLFEGPPVPEGIRFVLQHGHAPAGQPVELTWSRDSGGCACSVAAGPQFGPAEHLDLVAAVVRAWHIVGARGRLFDVDGSLGPSEPLVRVGPRSGATTLHWNFDPGTCPPGPAIDCLAAALRELEDAVGAALFAPSS